MKRGTNELVVRKEQSKNAALLTKGLPHSAYGANVLTR